jgi:hypothetical protein
MIMKTKPFIHVTPDYGWIEDIRWVNSRREAFMDPLTLRRSRTWGGWGIAHPLDMYLHGQETEDA